VIHEKTTLTDATRTEAHKAHTVRQGASHLIRVGRLLRSEGRRHPDKNYDLGVDHLRAATLMLKGVEEGRSKRRHMHLAAALLNGKAYRSCEPRHRRGSPPVDIDLLASIIEASLPDQADALQIADIWVTCHTRGYPCGKGLAYLLRFKPEDVDLRLEKAY